VIQKFFAITRPVLPVARPGQRRVADSVSVGRIRRRVGLQIVAQHFHHADREMPADQALHLVDRLSQVGHGVEGGPSVREGGRAGVGELRDPAGSVEQRGAQLVLQGPDLGTHPGLADVHPLRRAGEVGLLGHRQEVLELPKFHNHRF